MDILVVAAELSPYSRATAAADAVASLTKSLRQAGHNVCVVLPRGPGFDEQSLLIARRLTPLPLPGGGEVTVFDGQLASGARLVLFEDGREELDDVQRAGLLGRAAAALAREQASQGRGFDVAHLHDWPGAPAAACLARDPDLGLASVLTIHDARQQGECAVDELRALDLPLEPADWDGFSHDGRANLLALGVQFADAITTVSSGYADDLRDEGRFGAAAAAVVACDKPVIGIEHGVDYAIYNPATDPALISHYSAEDTANKGRCKTALIRDLGLELDTERPLLSASGDLTAERGFDLLAEALPQLLKSDVTVVLAGPAEPRVKDAIQAALARCGETFAHLESPDESTLRWLYAASDLVVCPAREEPCDATPRLAQRYGALPVAYAGGGLCDTVIDCDAALETGTGFSYAEATAQSLLGAAQRGIAAVRSAAFTNLRRRAMRLDLGWDRPVRRYLAVYRQAATARG